MARIKHDTFLQKYKDITFSTFCWIYRCGIFDAYNTMSQRTWDSKKQAKENTGYVYVLTLILYAYLLHKFGLLE